jgi:hypothetical protein
MALNIRSERKTEPHKLGKYFGFNRYSNLTDSVNPPEAGYDLPPLLSPSQRPYIYID